MSLTIFTQLPSGGFGHVFLCRKNGGIDDTKVYMVKVFKNKQTEKQHSVCRNELRIFRRLQKITFFHQLKYAFKTQQHYHFVMDFHPNGNLLNYILHIRTLTVNEAKICGAEIVQAISYLHEQSIVHCDIKLENILISRDCHILLSGFGLAKKIQQVKLCDQHGTTMNYIAPEMISGDQRYSFEVDWWSLGILLHETLVAHSPFVLDRAERSPKLHRVLSKQPNFSSLQCLQDYSPVLEQFISDLLIKDPEERLGAGKNGYKSVKSHQFFESLSWVAVKLKKYNCLSEFTFKDAIRINRDMIDITIEESTANHFYFVARELQTELDDDFVLGSTDIDIETLPKRIEISNSKCNIEMQLTEDIFLRSDGISAAANILKDLINKNCSSQRDILQVPMEVQVADENQTLEDVQALEEVRDQVVETTLPKKRMKFDSLHQVPDNEQVSDENQFTDKDQVPNEARNSHENQFPKTSFSPLKKEKTKSPSLLKTGRTKPTKNKLTQRTDKQENGEEISKYNHSTPYTFRNRNIKRQPDLRTQLLMKLTKHNQ